ncbi:MAG: AAA family ATPase [Bryobacterales bacterium]|nr:AAA family ATPase [Bryobacterales bacterium]
MVAPAGCGKTHLIAEAVSAYQGSGRQLVLTHTHAGVDAIRARLKKFKADPRRYRIETIAGWCLRMSSSFPQLSKLTSARPIAGEWETVYAAAALLLESATIRTVVAQSYGIWVDEYQDCTMAQHAVVMLLAGIIPCRILGDPLQGIFSFGELIDWDRDVRPNVDCQIVATTPWRWRDSNPALGTWLQGVRASLLAGQDVDLRGAPISWKTTGYGNVQQAQVAICRDIGADGSVLAITNG